MSFVGFGGEWPGQELPAGKQADFTGLVARPGRECPALHTFLRVPILDLLLLHLCSLLWPMCAPLLLATGFQGLECAQLVLTTQAPPPQGRLDFSIELGLTSEAAPVAAQRRRSLRMQPGDGSGGQLAAGDGAAAAASCGVPAAPTLRLRLPAGQQLSSVVWRDALNRTVAVQSGATLTAAAAAAGAASSAATWTTPAVPLPALYPFAESSHDPAAGCDAGLASCQLAQRRYSVRLLAPDGRHSVAAISAAPLTLAGAQLSIQVKHYEPHQLTQEQRSLSLPLGWPSADSATAASVPEDTFPAGIVIYDASGGAELALKDSQDAVVTGSSLPASGCSQQWTLSLQLSLTGTALAAAAAQTQASDVGKRHQPGSLQIAAAHCCETDVAALDPACSSCAPTKLRCNMSVSLKFSVPPDCRVKCCCLWTGACHPSAWALLCCQAAKLRQHSGSAGEGPRRAVWSCHTRWPASRGARQAPSAWCLLGGPPTQPEGLRFPFGFAT